MRPRILLVSVLAAGCLAPEISAQTSKADRPESVWGAKVGLSYLATGGNSETSSAGFDAGFNRSWKAWSLEGGANGVSVTRRQRRTAESFNGQVRAKRRFRRFLQIALGLRWERNRFAGLDSRQTADVSVLWEIRDTPTWKLRALGGISAGREDPRGRRPIEDSWGGLVQVSGDYKVSETASWDGQVTLFPSFDDPDDYRLHGRVGLQAALSRHLGLRLGYDLKYDHEPVPGFRTTDTSTTASLVVQMGKAANGG